MTPFKFSSAPTLVLMSCGTTEDVVSRLLAIADPLVARLGWSRIALPHRPDPAALAALETAAAGPGGLLALLTVDPGLWIQGLGTWAEALGAWRQPALVVLPAAAHRSGAAAALVALLRQEGVPLVGLIQLGGDWDPEQRRQDGLPWLGAWPVDEAGPADAFPADQAGEEVREEAEATVIRLRRALQGLAAAQ